MAMVIIKTPQEIEIMYEAGQINYACHMELKKYIESDISTWELDRIAEDFILKSGAKPAFKGYHGYPATINASINEEVVHGIPSKNRKLNDGEIISIDLGVIWKDYYADSAYTWAVGKIPQHLQKLMDVTFECLMLAIGMAREGKKIGDISATVQRHAEKHNYSVVRDLVGHGIGKRMHEDPKVPNFGKPGTGHNIRTGMVFAIEPMINMGTYHVEILEDHWTVVTRDRMPSAHFEHTVAITKNGPRILTAPEGSIKI